MIRGHKIGSLAQLGEHLPYKQRVIGSSPIVPTKMRKTGLSGIDGKSCFCFQVPGVFNRGKQNNGFLTEKCNQQDSGDNGDNIQDTQAGNRLSTIIMTPNEVTYASKGFLK